MSEAAAERARPRLIAHLATNTWSALCPVCRHGSGLRFDSQEDAATWRCSNPDCLAAALHREQQARETLEKALADRPCSWRCGSPATCREMGCAAKYRDALASSAADGLKKGA